MAYAAVASLVQNLQLILRSNTDPFLHDHKDHIESLYKDFRFIQSFLKNYKQRTDEHEMVKYLEAQIRVLAHEAEDFFDSHLYNNVSPKESALIICQSLPEIIDHVNSIKTLMLDIYVKNICSSEVQKAGNSLGRVSSVSNPKANDTFVGIDEDEKIIVDRLTGHLSRLEIIPIVGMGGIGKTTLANKVYNNPLVAHRFYRRAWITVSHEYETRELLLGLLSCITPQLTDEIKEKSKGLLAEKLYKSLKGMRYLIVMDDMWSQTAWDDLKCSFPDDNNGSRIMFTSRLTSMALYANGNSSPHHMHFLSLDQSWDLLHDKVFARESCPPELVQIGMGIAQKCKGLPLAIVVIAGLLSQSSKTRESWENVAATVDSLIMGDPEDCMDILALSYNHLPHHLKACFLYMGVFPEDFVIPVRRLTWLWVAEGFLQSTGVKSLEEVAEEYLAELIERSLILVGQRSYNGRVRTCHMHDLLRDLCLREFKRENFLLVVTEYAQLSSTDLAMWRRLSFHKNIRDFVQSKASIPFTRSFLSFNPMGELSALDSLMNVGFKLLRVLDIMFLHFSHFPIEIVQLVHLRYLCLQSRSELPASISSLQNLQILNFHCVGEALTLTKKIQIPPSSWKIWKKKSHHPLSVSHTAGQPLPREIWKMGQLRHLLVKRGCNLSDPSSIVGIEGNESSVLQNLQTLSLVSAASINREIVAMIPNLKKLGIRETLQEQMTNEQSSNFCNNLVSLHQLERLKCLFYNKRQKPLSLPCGNAFPLNLKKLTLSRSFLPWERMSTLGMLPNLEVLKLKDYAFCGRVWQPIDEEFLQLKFLLIENTNLEQWKATNVHFPSLQGLVLNQCNGLKEIPSDIGYIHVLRTIWLANPSYSAAVSAVVIQQEQQSIGNDGLLVGVGHGFSKTVLQLDSPDVEIVEKVKKTVRKLPGVESVAMDVEQNLTVVGNYHGYYSSDIVSKVRKFCSADMVSAGTAQWPEDFLIGMTAPDEQRFGAETAEDIGECLRWVPPWRNSGVLRIFNRYKK